jgi:hypothetical protein
MQTESMPRNSMNRVPGIDPLPNWDDARKSSKLNKAVLACQLLPRCKVNEAIRLFVSDEDGTGGAEEQESCDACGRCARRAWRCECDSAPDCRAEPRVQPKHQTKPQVSITGKNKGHDLPREVNARTADGAGADELVLGEGLNTAGLPALGMILSDDDKPALRRARRLRN